ncbi:MAG: hypothetical protein RL161_138 [Bacteroidota bacterium]|jgi:hypothetical protein
MATATKSGKKSKQGTEEMITSAYMDYLLINGKKPSTVYKFCKDLGLPESEFYKISNSFEALETKIWSGFMERAVASTQADKQFEGFSAREKMLSLYFVLLEILKQNRSFAMLTSGIRLRQEMVPMCLKDFRKTFEEFVAKVMGEGKSNGEVAERPYLDQRYPQLFWLHMIVLLGFWKDDSSSDFEQTDAFVEKSVNLAFDLIGKGTLDNAIDFAKFLFQSKFK